MWHNVTLDSDFVRKTVATSDLIWRWGPNCRTPQS